MHKNGDMIIFFFKKKKMYCLIIIIIGDHTIRLQSDGSVLPGPRELQLALFLNKAQDANDSRNFHINEVGQWLAHDITLMSPDLSGNALL